MSETIVRLSPRYVDIDFIDTKEEKRRHTELKRLNRVLYGMSQNETREAREAYFVANPEGHKLYGCIGGGDKHLTKPKGLNCVFFIVSLQGI